MHPNPIYRRDSSDQHLEMARNRGFGTLAVNGADGPLLSHVPFVVLGDLRDGAVNPDAPLIVEFHIMRSNPIAVALRDGAMPAVLAVTGPDAYVSPDWYGADDQVPTWNYIATHLRGSLMLAPADQLDSVLAGLTYEMERRLAPKPIWTMDKLTPETHARFVRMIVPLRMVVSSVDGTRKLGQNKTPAMRAGVAAALRADPVIGQEIADLAAMMDAVAPE